MEYCYTQDSWNLDCRDLGVKESCDVFLLTVEGEMRKEHDSLWRPQLSDVSTEGLLGLGSFIFPHSDQD